MSVTHTNAKLQVQRAFSWLYEGELPWVLIAFSSTFLLQSLFVKYFGVNIPYWDEWSGVWLFDTFQRGDLNDKLKILFSQHNEHRIVLARLVFLGSYYLLGDWNLLSQMLISAFLVGCCAGIFTYALRKLEFPFWVIFVGCFLLTSAVQFDNIIVGFQVEFYMLLLGMLFIAVSLAMSNSISWRLVFIIIGSCLFCTLTLASGLFMWGVAGVGLVLKAWMEKRSFLLVVRDRSLLAKIVVCMLIAVACGLLYLYGYESQPQHKPLKAKTLQQAGAWFVEALSYPLLSRVTIHTVLLASFQWLIIILGLALYFVQRNILLYQRKLVFVMSILLFVGVNASISAYSRGATVGGIPSRYGSLFLWTSIIFFLIASDVLRFLLARSVRLWGAAFLVFLCIMGVALMQLNQSINGIAHMSRIKAERLERGNTVIAELRDPHYVIQGVQPIPSPLILQQLQNDPDARALLPHWLQAQARWPIQGTTTGDAWIAGWGNPGSPSSFSGWGSWRGNVNNTATGRFESEPIHITQSTLVLPVAGHPTMEYNALMLEVVGQPDMRVVYTDADPGATWQNWYADVSRFSGRDMRIVAIDNSKDSEGWFAFENPWQVNYLSRYIDLFFMQLELICGALILIFLIALPIGFDDRRLKAEPHNDW